MDKLDLIVIIFFELLLLMAFSITFIPLIIEDFSIYPILIMIVLQILAILLFYFVLFKERSKPKKEKPIHLSKEIINKVVNQQTIIYSKRDIPHISFWGTMAIIGVFGIVYSIIDLIYNLNSNNDLKSIFGDIFLLTIVSIMSTWFIWEILSRTLVISKKGIKFYVGRTLKYDIKWNNIKNISKINLAISGFTIIIETKQYSSLKEPDEFEISRISKIQLKKSFEILRKYSKKFKFVVYD